jgi:hypothetical protein
MMAALSFRRKILVLGAAIAVLAAAYVLGLVFSPARMGRREAETPLLPDFNRNQRDLAAAVELVAAEGSLRLLNKGESWVLPGGGREYPASRSRIVAFFNFLAETKRTRVVTDNPEAWAEFELSGDEARRRIRVLDGAGNILTEIIIGKPATGGGYDYVRLGDSNEVVLSNRSFSYYLNVEDKFWSYLRVLPEDLEGQDLIRISVDSEVIFQDGSPGPLDYTLVLDAEQQNLWRVADRPQLPLDNGEVDLLANNLADLEGTEFAAAVGRAEAGLTDPAGQILLSTQDDKDFRLLIGGPAGEDQFYVARQDGPYIYKVSEWRLKGILKSVDDLLEERSQE